MTQTAEIAPDRPTDSTLEADMLALGRKARAAARDLGLASQEALRRVPSPTCADTAPPNRPRRLRQAVTVAQ